MTSHRYKLRGKDENVVRFLEDPRVTVGEWECTLRSHPSVSSLSITTNDPNVEELIGEHKLTIVNLIGRYRLRGTGVNIARFIEEARDRLEDYTLTTNTDYPFVDLEVITAPGTEIDGLIKECELATLEVAEMRKPDIRRIG